MSLKSLLKKLKLFAKEEEGASGIEYAIIAAMVAVVIVGYSGDISTKIDTIFSTISTELGATG